MKIKLSLAVFMLAGALLPAVVAGKNHFSNSINVPLGAPKVSVTIEPFDGNAVLYSPLAASHAGDQPESLIALALKIANQEALAVKLTKVKVSFGGQPKVANVFYQPDFSVGANKTSTLNFDRDLNIHLPFPAPQTIILELTFDGFTPVIIVKPLMAHVNPVAQGSYLFPAKTADLASGEFWSGASGHPGSDQRFAYDMGVVAWDFSKSEWSGKYPGKAGDKNEDYRIWNKPIYAMADGTVISCKMNEPNNPVPGEKITGGGGNSFLIQHGPNEKALYAHMRAGTVTAKFCQPGATVKAGELLGRAGNSGSSTAPHLHIHAVAMNDELRPLRFRNLTLVERTKLDVDELKGPWVLVNGKALPYGKPVIWPAPAVPKKEVTCGSLSTDINKFKSEIAALQADLQDAGPSQKSSIAGQIKAAQAKVAALKAEAEKRNCP